MGCRFRLADLTSGCLQLARNTRGKSLVGWLEKLTTNKAVGTYQLVTKPGEMMGHAIFRFSAVLEEGNISIGVSSKKGQWLQVQALTQGASSTPLVFTVPKGSALVVFNNEPKRSRVLIKNLEIFSVPQS